MAEGVFTLDLNEKFPRLSLPPIVEAAIHWQARADNPLELDALRDALVEKLPKFTRSEPIQGFGILAKLSSEESPVVRRQDRGFLGLRLSSDDDTDIVQFKRDGLAFSRVKNYEHWEPFVNSALEVWRVFIEIAAPLETQRLGVRFINHIASATPETLGNYLRDPPTCAANLPLKEFVYQSTFTVPTHPFGVRVIKVMQPPMQELQQSSGLFLDIDVFSTRAIPNDPADLERALVQMRWLKNKVFFTLLTENTVHAFEQGGR